MAATTLVDPNRAEARHGVALDLACLPCFGEVLWTDLTGERPLQPDAYDSLIARALDAAAKVGEMTAPYEYAAAPPDAALPRPATTSMPPSVSFLTMSTPSQ